MHHLHVRSCVTQSISRAVDHLSEVYVLFADLVGFTKASAEYHPNFLIGLFLRDVFLEFDRCVEKHGLEKIKSIGKRGVLLLHPTDVITT